MISLPKAVAVCLLVLLLRGDDPAVYGVEGIEGGRPVLFDQHLESFRPETDCYNISFLLTRANWCLKQHGLDSFQFPWEFEYLFRLADSNMDFCRGPQQPTEAYRCFFGLAHTCLDQFRADAALEGDNDTVIAFHNLEQYMPDPDLFEVAIQYSCQIQGLGSDVLCLKNWETIKQLLLCESREFLKLLPEALRLIVTDSSEDLNELKRAICRTSEGLQRCAAGMRACPQRTISFFHTMLTYLNPPACSLNDGMKTVRDVDQGKAGRGKSSHFHDEI